jgi:hypothetical protein
MSRQQLVEHSRKDKKGNVIPYSLAEAKEKCPWAKAFVNTEGGYFCFSSMETAKVFVGEKDPVASIEV